MVRILTSITAAEGSNQNGYVKSTASERSALIVEPATTKSFSYVGKLYLYGVMGNAF